ncbi:Protein phosphatase ImpM [hydrothermal vent metagenome]|uniref:Protein phosphatase ImpM n=1 Tax=hydrothermal vent metagenome TaxID=652676 RepID=A0A3B0XIC9_9ZZZZ
MSATTELGLYGKLPAYGDFIFRNLNSSFINPWDEWLQHFISGSQEQIGDTWLDIYLTSPIWRFVFSPGVIDNNVWAGLMMPSVDRVGRYFPISVVMPLATNTCPVNFMMNQQQWFSALENHCLTALDGSIDADELMGVLTELCIQPQEIFLPTPNLGEMGPAVFGLTSGATEQLNSALPYMLNAALTTALSSFSLWQTAGSELIGPAVFNCQGLPPIGGIGSMLDGQWQARNWKLPYNIQLV